MSAWSPEHQGSPWKSPFVQPPPVSLLQGLPFENFSGREKGRTLFVEIKGLCCLLWFSRGDVSGRLHASRLKGFVLKIKITIFTIPPIQLTPPYPCPLFLPDLLFFTILTPPPKKSPFKESNGSNPPSCPQKKKRKKETVKVKQSLL